MKIIGICGSSGSGKSYVCGLFAKYGIAHIDTDKLYREVTVKGGTACLKELTESFGDEILDENGELNRRALSKIVFEGENAREKRELLNSITHKHILIDTNALIEKYRQEGKRAVLVDAPLLFESGFNKICHFTICVTSPLEEKIQRIIARDKISESSAVLRLKAQKSDEELRALCDYEIDNSSTSDQRCQIESQIEIQIESLISKII